MRRVLAALAVAAVLTTGGPANAEPCRPPRGMACQRPPATVQEAVRRTLNRNGEGINWRTWFALAYCESRWTPDELVVDSNGYYSRGLFQINDQWHSWRWRGRPWADPVVNTLVAIDIKRAAGFTQWSCYR